jgi:hypothetical protein
VSLLRDVLAVLEHHGIRHALIGAAAMRCDDEAVGRAHQIAHRGYGLTVAESTNRIDPPVAGSPR